MRCYDRKYLSMVRVVIRVNVFSDCMSFKMVLFMSRHRSSPGFTNNAASMYAIFLR